MSKTTRISQKDDSMNKLSLEKYFTAIKEDIDEFKQEFIDFRKEVIERFDKQDRILKMVLDISRTYDQERKEVKSTLWEYDRRLLKLEKQLS